MPVLWDKASDTLADNKSSEIIRMFDTAFDARRLLTRGPGAGERCLNARMYDAVNDGVHKAGLVNAQESYDAAFAELFKTLEVLEEHLGTHRYLLGERLTEADWRLFTTLVRFDPVYGGSPTTRTCPAICAISAKCPASPGPYAAHQGPRLRRSP
jgi:putative glutathione S-transferase